MKKNKFKRVALLALALILVAGLIPAATPASAAEESYTLHPNTLKATKNGAPEGYDGITVGKVYEHAYYTVDMDFLLDGFSAENFFKEHSQCDLYLCFIDNGDWFYSDAKASYFLNGSSTDWSWEYPYITYKYEDTPYEKAVWHLDYPIGKFTAPFTAPRVTVMFDLHNETPRFKYSLALEIRDHKTDEVVFTKRIRINLCTSPTRIGELEIQNFDFQQKHGFLLKRDTKDVWCDAGNVESIRYLAEDKKTEYTETAARAGMTGWIEFTVSKAQKGCLFDTKVQAGLFASRYTGTTVDTTASSDGSWCKAYFHFSIPDDDKYVIKKGTINLTAPEAGAKADSKVTLSNVELVPGRGSVKPTPQFKAGEALWLTYNRRALKVNPVTSFSALNAYQALVKLEPHGSYYFNAESEAAIKVPGAESFTIDYLKAGDLNGNVKEDGWYLLAVFPVVQPKTFNLTIGYDKPDMTVTQGDRAFLTATSSCDLTKAGDVSVQWYYSEDISRDPTGELCGASDGDLKLQLVTDTVGTGYYKCVISCTQDGKTAVVSYPGGEWAKVTVKKASTEPTQKPTEPTQKPTEPTQKPTEPTQNPTEPTTPPPTDPVSTDPTDPVSTDPVSTDPVSTDPDATVPDSQPATAPGGSDTTAPNTEPSGPAPQPTTPAPTGNGGSGSESGGNGLPQLWWLWLLLLLLIAAAVTFCIVKKRNGNHQEGETT